MYLTTSNLEPYLIERELLATNQEMAAPIRVFERMRSRHLSLRLTDGTGFFIKQANQPDTASSHLLHREAAIYKTLQMQSPQVASVMPRFVDFDPIRCVLVIELLDDLAGGSEVRKSDREEVAAQLGKTLALLHGPATPIESLANQLDGTLFPRQPALILTMPLHRLADSFFPGHPAMSQVQQLLQDNSKQQLFRSMCQELRARWEYSTLIHGDMRSSNVLIRNRGEALNICLADWEIADVGDPAWDLVGAVCSYLIEPCGESSWVDSAIRRICNREEQALVFSGSSIQAFWEAYVVARGLDKQAGKTLRQNTVCFLAAKILQTSLESLLFSSRLETATIRLLDASLDIYNNPDAAEALFIQ